MCNHEGKNKDKLEKKKCQCFKSRLERFIQPCLLLLLCEKPNCHGYDLLVELKAFGFDASPDPGVLYRNLRRLEQEGLVASRWETGEGGPARRLYELTSEGRELLHAWAENITRNREYLDYFLERYGSHFKKRG